MTKKRFVLFFLILLLISSIFVASKSNAEEYAFFQRDLYGNWCKGGLFLLTEEGLDRHVETLYSLGSKMPRKNQSKKNAMILNRYKYFKKKLNEGNK